MLELLRSCLRSRHFAFFFTLVKEERALGDDKHKTDKLLLSATREFLDIRNDVDAADQCVDFRRKLLGQHFVDAASQAAWLFEERLIRAVR